MEENYNKNRFLSRRDSGELRALVIGLFCIVAIFFGFFGWFLIGEGVSGEWSIVSSFKGLTLYITSISPGLLVFLFATIILVWGLPKVLKNL
jgi:hypothetical protein